MIRAMCEQFVARALEPFRLDELWPLAEKLERFGLAGFGWGATWIESGGRLGCHRDIRAFRDDDDRGRIGAIETTSLLVHLRRPSRLSTLSLPDTQPFADPRGRFAFSHNGDFRDWRPARRVYGEQGRIQGRADTEVGERWLEDHWDEAPSTASLLTTLHRQLGGQANLATLATDGTAVHYAGNTENPVFSFRLGRIGVVSTGLYSLDRSLFTFAAAGATDRRLVRLRTSVALDAGGRAGAAT
jgi:hypothetical protein